MVLPKIIPFFLMWDFPKYKPSSYWPTRSSSMPWSFVTWNRSSSCPRLSLALLCISSRLFTLGSLAEGEHVRTLWDDVGWYGLFFGRACSLQPPKSTILYIPIAGDKMHALTLPISPKHNEISFLWSKRHNKKTFGWFRIGNLQRFERFDPKIICLDLIHPPPNRGWGPINGRFWLPSGNLT